MNQNLQPRKAVNFDGLREYNIFSRLKKTSRYRDLKMDYFVFVVHSDEPSDLVLLQEHFQEFKTNNGIIENRVYRISDLESQRKRPVISDIVESKPEVVFFDAEFSRNDLIVLELLSALSGVCRSHRYHLIVFTPYFIPKLWQNADYVYEPKPKPSPGKYTIRTDED